MNIYQMDYFLADYFDKNMKWGKLTQDHIDRLSEAVEAEIHGAINSILWDKRWMDEDFPERDEHQVAEARKRWVTDNVFEVHKHI